MIHSKILIWPGHRVSIDLDLFTPDEFDASQLEQYLIDKYDFEADFLAQNTLKGYIRDVRIDCITHKYPYIGAPITEDGIRLYDLRDIVAMKLSAIADNGTRLKDFIDIAFLSTKMSFSEMLGCYQAKFKAASTMRPIKGLTFFDEINFNEPIQLINGKFDWKLISKRLQMMTKNSSTIFKELPIERSELGLTLLT